MRRTPPAARPVAVSGSGCVSLVGSGPGIERTEDTDLLESTFVELDPLEDGFAGVLLEAPCRGDRYILLGTSSISGNRLSRFSPKDREPVYTAFAKEQGGSPH